MRRQVRILPEAREDVQSIFDWIDARSERGALRWQTALDEAIEYITEFAEACGEAIEAAETGFDLKQKTFKTPAGRRYRIVFAIVGTQVLIFRVRGPGQRSLGDR